MTARRRFLQGSLAAAAAMTLPRRAHAAPEPKKILEQLHGDRDGQEKAALAAWHARK